MKKLRNEKKNIRRAMSAVLAVLMLVSLTAPAVSAEAKEVSNVETTYSVYDAGKVMLTDEYCVNAINLEIAYLLEFDTDKLLAGFRDTAGIDMKGATRYSGWENSLIGGHTLGHYLTACAQGYAGANASDTDKSALYGKICAIVDGLKECQENSKGQPGFIFGATVISRDNVEIQFDNVQKGKTNISTEAWVPWYTMHKIIQGLVDVYNLTGYEPAKEVVSALGDWVYGRTSSWSTGVHNTVLSIEYGGMNDCMYEVYAITGKAEHAEAAHAFDETTLFNSVKSGGTDVLNNRHANTTIPKFIGALNRYIKMDGQTDAAGNVIDADIYLEYAKSFWDMVIEHHTYITGGNSEWEHFGSDDVLDMERTNCNCETCNTYNMLKLSSMLYCITGEAKYADYYENAYINTILSSQNPTTGMTTYFQPMASGYFKVYGEKFNKFWCCTGSGMENFTKLHSNLYYSAEDTVYAALFISSEIELEEFGVTLVQESEVLEGGGTKFTVKSSQNKTFGIGIRIPSWEQETPVIKLNGAVVTPAEENGYLVLRQEFKNGDTIEAEFHMAVEAEGLPDKDNVFAFRYGPVVLSALLGDEDMWTSTTGVNVTVPGEEIIETEELIIDESEGTMEDYIANINNYMVKDSDSMTFTLTGTDYELTFVPHYSQHSERYGLYWYFESYADSLLVDKDAPKAELDVLDTVQPGYGQYENDVLHSMQESGTVGVTSDGTYRYAEAGGSFSYRMIVDTEKDTYLQITLRKEDNGKSLKITSGTSEIFNQVLNYEGEETSYQIQMRIPFAVIKENMQTVLYNGRKYASITLTFAGADGAESARVCDFIRTGVLELKYETDAALAYFVDCGDHDPSTISDGDLYGVYNSVTEQSYGPDPATGYYWGIVDDTRDQYGGSGLSAAVYTANTWAYEYNKVDGIAKTLSNRYTKNQLETGITPRYLDYSFELPNGTYEVEVGFSDPWACSNYPSVYANMGKANETLIADKLDLKFDDYTSGQTTVTDGVLTVNLRSESSAINVTYIKVKIVSVDEDRTVTEGEVIDLDSQAAANPDAGATVPTPPGEGDDSSSGRDALIFGIIAAVVLAIAAVVVVFLVRKKKK